jgi:major membrane immunogen (membrane-anchored lipoprotein)
MKTCLIKRKQGEIMKKVALALLLTTVLLTACGKSSMDHGAMMGPEHENHQMGNEAESQHADEVKATFKLSTEMPQPNQDTTIKIDFQDKQGKAIEKYDISHEKQLHLIVVSKDLSYFNHIHPEYKGNGEFMVTTQLPVGGEYKLIADFIPSGMGDMTKTQWVTVQGDAPNSAAIEPDANLTKVVDGKEITLSMDHVMSGMDLNMVFTIKDAKTKEPIKSLQPYLGAVGHVVILSENTDTYLHVHPTEEKATGPEAKFMTSFPKSGVYKIWGQFQHKGKVFIVPFVVKVP